ncbi:pentapeptide repeat-containing protein [Faecalicatena orotica]|uniref:Pentapeptide repeat protein n=1 Tax=Faecalicatena orotica TaxID=1544 RepID=A0A2Y9BK33_9FIRM|nr:pentapeptide repeat-containing protein [Faecalicatena orotica]PWJ23146.1 pentapeptide repeat protein [Faecalicatena orotica]SSA57883.1 Pentapeptide repeat-containing protein [Faecalicatena orotica]
MDYSIISKELSFPSKKELDHAVESLLKHCKNKTKFKAAPFIVAVGGNDNGDYTGESLKRSKFNQKRFQGSIFRNTAAAGSIFQSCTFDNCVIANANFQECFFPGAQIMNHEEDHAVTNTNFNQSLFDGDFLIDHVKFQHSVFQKTAFINGNISNTNFYSCTLEDTLFDNVNMNRIRFSDLNIDYAEFNDIHMDDVVLPFSQICFTYGLLSYLMTTNDSVYITSFCSSEGRIRKEEYLDLLDILIVYYTGTYDLFPLANIYLAQGEYQLAQTAILSGILSASNEGNFRLIKYFSKLINKYEVFDFHDRQKIYDYINTHISFPDLTKGDLFNYLSYKYEIETFLLDNNKSGIATAELSIFTNINHRETLKLGFLLTTLEKIIEFGSTEKEEHHITCRHNSNVEFLLKIQDVYEALKIIIPSVYSILLGSFILQEKVTKRKLDKIDLQYKKTQREYELEKAKIDLKRSQIALENEELELNKKKQLQELEKQKVQQEILRKDITKNDIQVTKVHHIIYGNIPSDAPPEIIQYSKFK